ncbi:dynamin family protein [Streptomyces sp. NPDC093261]|uniref:dynamin family protein n=1 Tax=Streptomyces sp. NPDC093261 TaxID=3366037 RepID=UPI003812573D
MTSSASAATSTASSAATVASTSARLRSALSRLETAGIPEASEDQRLLEAVGEQLAQDRFRVLVVGDAKRGKSTLVNALLGRQVLPTGVVPVTALSTVVRADPPEGMSVWFSDGRTEQHPLQALSDFVTQRSNPGNRLGVEEVVVRLDTPRLPAGIELVDTPGTGSVHEHNTEQARAALKTMDAALFVLSADPPVSAAERELLAEVAAASVRVFVVLNKADLLDETDLPEAVDYLRAVAGEVFGEPVTVHVCVARPDRQRGVTELRNTLGAYLDRNRHADLQRSLARRLGSLTAALLDEVLMARAMAEAQAARKLEYRSTLRQQVERLGERRQEARDAARAEAGRLLDGLNAAAAQADRPLTQQVAERLAADWPALCTEHAGPGLESAGRTHLVALVRQAVEPWRAQQEQWLDGRLVALDARLREGLDRDIGVLREEISDLLGVRPLLEYDGTSLAPNPRFHYHLTEDVGQSELLAG